jgi:SAM-dependent methyltransferase
MKGGREGIGARDFVMLDPAVELLEGDHSGCRLLCHHALEMGMSLPPGEGLVDLLACLTGGFTGLAALRRGFDDEALVDEFLASLHRNGFLLAGPDEAPDPAQLEGLRLAARRRRSRAARPALAADLDGGAPLEPPADPKAPADLHLRCARLGDHEAEFERLAALRRDGLMPLHHAVVRTRDPSCGPAARRALLQLGASVVLEGVQWPPPDRTMAGLAELVRHPIPVHARLDLGPALLEEAERARAARWAGALFLTGLRLAADPETLWPGGRAGEADFLGLFESVQTLADAFGDARIDGLPDDEILTGRAQPRPPAAPAPPFRERFRRAYLGWRLARIKGFESGFTWSQSPEVEARFVRPEDDLLPNRPDLLDLREGSLLLDVCGGLGRVARRLAPAVGATGLVVSVEMDPCLVDRARGFVAAPGTGNVQFRVGIAQRIPLPDAAVDAAVNEWTGAIWELGLGPAMVAEMARVVRPGGRIAVTHRLVQLPLNGLRQPWVQYDEIHAWVRGAFEQEGLRVLSERIWGQIVPSLAGEKASCWREQHLPPVVDPFDFHYDEDQDPAAKADVYLTLIAERIGAAA